METKQKSIDQVIIDAVREASEKQSPDYVTAAIRSIHPDKLKMFYSAGLTSDTSQAKPITTGLPASPGAAVGEVVLEAAQAVDLAAQGKSVILVRSETNPDDMLGMQSSKGVLTARGGVCSHAAIVARGWGKPAVVGANDLRFVEGGIEINGNLIHEGDYITIDGTTGAVYIGKLEISSHEPPKELKTLLNWADQIAEAGNFEVRVNADTYADAKMGRTLGAKGIGLCRTEHMFLSADRLPMMRSFILSETEEEEKESLQELEKAQVSDFEEVLDAMDTLPVKVRLLDPPLHEFLPDILELTAKEAKGKLSDSEVKELAAVRRLHEKNPMIGTRGVRLGMIRPGLYEMQVRSLLAAAANQIKKGKHPRIEIMIPLIIDEKELEISRKWVTDELEKYGHSELTELTVPIGAMIETPRAALVAGSLAEHADFFSFGTNDLTQMTFGFSRDDVESSILPDYRKKGILKNNPFATVDQDGVGLLVKMGCESSRTAKPSVVLSVCGEHAGNPDSVDFFVKAGVDSVSCSPFRVPLSRLAAAQALLESGRVRADKISFDFEMPQEEACCTSEVAENSAEPVGEMILTADEDFVLYLLRIRGYITSDGLMDSVGMVPSSIMEDLVKKGWVDHMEAQDIYTLTSEGTEQQQRRLDASANPSLAQALMPAYKLFLELNNEFKGLCNDWQLKDGAPNDHSDTAYDQIQLDRLKSIVERGQPIISNLAEHLPRLARYNSRLQKALNRVLSGEIKMFTGVMCGSVHDIWMELHEDLILQQNIDRAEEGSF
ncbi:MAG: PEP-utilizing enzyme [Sphaerochaetaceae bacterium]|nr:PEP-utilizing enzyme [Sphaerochaetaceae bacterium]